MKEAQGTVENLPLMVSRILEFSARGQPCAQETAYKSWTHWRGVQTQMAAIMSELISH